MGGIPSRTSGYEGYGARRSALDQRPAESRPGPSYGGFTRAMAGANARSARRPAAAPAPASAAPAVSYQKGDMVRHKAFGRGMILSLQKMGGDALVEIAFDDVGTKRLMLKSAAAHMEKVTE